MIPIIRCVDIAISLQMIPCNDVDALKRLVRDKIEVVLGAGYTRDMRNITMVDKEQIIRALFLHSTIYRSMAELDQLKAGLNELGIYDMMKSNPSVFFAYFTRKEQKLSAGQCL